MGRGETKCPICGGRGFLTENSQEYEFITRDPLTSVCLTCCGRGKVGAQKKLPNGVKVHELKKQQRRKQDVAQSESGRRVNVSRGARIRTVSTEGTESAESADIGKEGVGLDSSASPQNEGGALVIERDHALYLPIFRELRAWGRVEGKWDSAAEARYVEALERRLQDMEKLGELIDKVTEEAENG